MSTVSIRALTTRYGQRLVFEDVSVDLGSGQCLGVIGPNGAGKTTLLRAIVGLMPPSGGEVRICGRPPRHALPRTPVAYFAGEATLPGFVHAFRWGRLGADQEVTPDRRPLRALSRGSRQLLGLRTVLGRHPLALVVLDEPWEALDPDACRWLTATLTLKRDRGAALVLASHRLDDLAGLCDAYLLLHAHRSLVVKAYELAPTGAVTAPLLEAVFERVLTGSRQR
jgi:ABC-2 type transport system ATP-binding protein